LFFRSRWIWKDLGDRSSSSEELPTMLASISHRVHCRQSLARLLPSSNAVGYVQQSYEAVDLLVHFPFVSPPEKMSISSTL